MGRSLLIPLSLHAHIAPATLIPGAGTEIRRDEETYEADDGWFNTCWHFCFDRYRDPEQMRIGPLRRIADAAWDDAEVGDASSDWESTRELD